MGECDVDVNNWIVVASENSGSLAFTALENWRQALIDNFCRTRGLTAFPNLLGGRPCVNVVGN